MNLPVFQIAIQKTEDLDLARHYVKRLASLAGLSAFDQARLATALAEITFNALRHAGGGSVELSIAEQGRRQFVRATVVDHGPGIDGLDEILGRATKAEGSPHSGLAVARKLVDRFSVDSHPQAGTVVMLDKALGTAIPRISEAQAAAWAEMLRNESPTVISTLPAQQNRELYDALAALRQHERNLQRQLRRVQQLNEKLDVLSLVASNTDHSVVITDRNGLIEWVNDGFSRITGYEPLEVVGKKPGQLLQGPQTDPQTVERIREALRSGNSFTEEILNYHKDGHPYWIAMNIFPVRDKRGNVVRFMAIQNDVSNHLQVEEDLHTAKDAAEKANQAKSELLANMSHEIRTPMNAVIGMTDLLFDTNLDSEQREYLSIVKESAHSLLRLLDDVLDFSKIEAGKLLLEAVPFDLRDTLAATMKPFAPRAVEKGRVGSELGSCAANVPQRVVGDPQRWRQVLTNLVGNALKFTLAGEVAVRLEFALQDEKTVQIRGLVRDTGIGIPADKLEHIFESFAQADSSMTRRFGGTGLGLTITAQLVAMMGGRVWVRKCRGMRAARSCSRSRSLPRRPDGRPAGDGLGIVVPQPDRERPVLRASVDGVGGRGYSCQSETGTADSRKTWACGCAGRRRADGPGLFRQQAFDAVLMDVQMPEQDGLRTATAIRELEQSSGRRTPIIAVTAHAHAGRSRCLPGLGHGRLPGEATRRARFDCRGGRAGRGCSRAAECQLAERPAAPEPASSATFDFKTALARMEDDLELFAQLLAILSGRRTCPAWPESNGPATTAIHSTWSGRHTISKGWCEISKPAKPRCWPNGWNRWAERANTAVCASTYRQLRAEVERLIAALNEFLAENVPSKTESTG